jgi:type II secretory pathway predicted ATPase ExeA
MIRQERKPVALFVDEAHDLHGHTLRGLKRLIEVAQDSGGTLAIVLAGHPRLKNDPRRPTLEEIGYRATIFAREDLSGHGREYIDWLLRVCAKEGVAPQDILTAEHDATVNLSGAPR